MTILTKSQLVRIRKLLQDSLNIGRTIHTFNDQLLVADIDTVLKLDNRNADR